MTKGVPIRTDRKSFRDQAGLIVAVSLMLSCLVILGLRAKHDGLSLAALSPRTEWMLSLQVAMDVHGELANARILVPGTDELQTVRAERVESEGLSYSVHERDGNRQAVFQADRLKGHQVAAWHAIVRVAPRHWVLPEHCAIPTTYPEAIIGNLQPSATVQSDDVEIMALAKRLTQTDDIGATIRNCFDFVHREIRPGNYENALDARTTLRWKEAFCGGKSRLLAALLRAAGIPARLVGGFILERGTKRTTHAWIEAWINGLWVPFDALNDHFAERPAKYLMLYRGCSGRPTGTGTSGRCGPRPR